MFIRLLTDSDKIEHEKVASQAFCFGTDFSDVEELPAPVMPAAFDEKTGALMADMEILGRDVSFGKERLSCATIGGVASKPEYRRHGAIRAILNEVSGNLASEYGWDIAILYPFNADYYKKFGYQSAGTCFELTVPFSALKNIEYSSAELYEGKNLDELLEFYNSFAKKYCLNFFRTDGYYFPETPYKDEKYTYMRRNGNGKINAYATFSVSREKSTVFVQELAYSDCESLLGILGFLKVYGGNFETLVFSKLPEDCRIVNFLTETEKTKIRLYSLGAARIFNLKSVLEKKEYPAGKGYFSIKVTDSVKRNCGVFAVEYENGKGTVTVSDDGDADVVLDERALNIILHGVKDAEELSYIPGAQLVNGNTQFFDAFKPTVCFFCDGF